MSLQRMLIFTTVVITLTASLHYYFWARLVRDTALPQPWRTLATALIVLLAVGTPLVMLTNRLLPNPISRLFALPAYVWIGAMMLLFFALVASDLVRLLAWALHTASGAPADPERRLLFRRAVSSAAASLAGVLSLRALQNGLGPATIKNVEVALPNLPPQLDGLTIAQLTDIHVGGPLIGRQWIEKLVQRTNEVGADLIAITGDLVDGSVADLGHAVAPIAELRARLGVFFVTGNHEYYAGAPQWCAHLGTLGVRVLRNERVRVESGGHGFDLAGVDDYSSLGLAPGHGPDMEKALAGRDPRSALVLLAHQPRHIHEAAERGVGLQLSGHTHGGQIWPWGFFVRLQQRYLAGLSRIANTTLYVSCGTGYWGPPMRLDADPEITRITLRARPA